MVLRFLEGSLIAIHRISIIALCVLASGAPPMLREEFLTLKLEISSEHLGCIEPAQGLPFQDGPAIPRSRERDAAVRSCSRCGQRG
jgi:hypothetical protein